MKKLTLNDPEMQSTDLLAENIERMQAAAARQDPRAWEGWGRYKKTRDYQIRAQIWGA